MPILIVLIIFLYLGAKILIPILETFLHLFILLGALAPFLLFIGIGVIIGLIFAVEEEK